MGFRLYSNERTKLAFDGTPEARVSDRHGDLTAPPSLHPEAPARGLPDGHPAGLRSVISHGVNDLSDNEYALLARDVNFQRHIKSGVFVFLNDDGAAIDPPEAPEYVAQAPAVAPGLTVVNQGAETDPPIRTDEAADPKAPVKPGAKADKAKNKDVEDYFGMNAEDRAAMYPALTPEVKTLVDADPRSKPEGAK